MFILLFNSSSSKIKRGFHYTKSDSVQITCFWKRPSTSKFQFSSKNKTRFSVHTSIEWLCTKNCFWKRHVRFLYFFFVICCARLVYKGCTILFYHVVVLCCCTSLWYCVALVCCIRLLYLVSLLGCCTLCNSKCRCTALN